MTGNELAVAVQHQLPLVVIVSSNGSYGTIRLHQEKSFPGWRIATDLANPDFASLAEALGAAGIKVARDDEIEAALDRAFAAKGPALIDVKTSLEHISAFTTLGAIAAAKRGYAVRLGTRSARGKGTTRHDLALVGEKQSPGSLCHAHGIETRGDDRTRPRAPRRLRTGTLSIRRDVPIQ
jgi:hypothetical protein